MCYATRPGKRNPNEFILSLVEKTPPRKEKSLGKKLKNGKLRGASDDCT